jgi:hypothetical protein
MVAVDQIEGVFPEEILQPEDSKGGKGNPDHGNEGNSEAVDCDSSHFRGSRGGGDDMHFVT